MKGNGLDSVIGIYGHEYDGDLPRSREIVEQAFSCLCVTKQHKYDTFFKLKIVCKATIFVYCKNIITKYMMHQV